VSLEEVREIYSNNIPAEDSAAKTVKKGNTLKNFSNREMAFLVIFGFIGLNLLGFLLARVFKLDRPLFNLDYLIPFVIYLWVSRSFSAISLMAVIILDILKVVIPSYFATTEAFSVLFWIKTIRHWPAKPMLMAGTVLTIVTIIAVMVFRQHRLSRWNRGIGTLCVLFLGLAGISADWLNGSLDSARGDSTHVMANLSYSPAYLIFRTTIANMRETTKAVFNPLDPTMSASGRYFAPFLRNSNNRDIEGLGDAEVAALLPDKIVLIVVESLSVPRSDTNLLGMLTPLKSLEGRYEIESGTLEWFGSTLRGEIRELCWRNLEGWNFGELPPSLPLVLKKAGYESSLFHGFFGSMYNRDKQYPHLGFDRLTFLDQMQATDNVPLAGALFRGAKDGYVAGLVHSELSKPGRRFVHWMTLSGHTPIDMDYAREVSVHSLKDSGMPDSVWAHYEIRDNVFRLIAKIAADESIGNCDFIIVGDHPVPFSNPAARAWFCEHTIPYVLLRQKGKSNPSL
jgi:hypothetical protein